MNIATDFAIFAIPIWPVTQLHMPLKRKAHLLAVFCLGFLYVFISTTFGSGDVNLAIAPARFPLSGFNNSSPTEMCKT